MTEAHGRKAEIRGVSSSRSKLKERLRGIYAQRQHRGEYLQLSRIHIPQSSMAACSAPDPALDAGMQR